jgi:hypothetical protein
MPSMFDIADKKKLFPEKFSFEEMTVSQTAARRGIDNEPKDAQTLLNLLSTANHMLDVRKLLLNRPILISSGYRSPELNAAVGGSNNSAHTKGWAVDFTCPGYGSPLEIAREIAYSDVMNNVDQLIHEYDKWVHISFDPQKRNQVLTINKSGTKSGLH